MNKMMNLSVALIVAVAAVTVYGAEGADYEAKWAGASLKELSDGVNTVAHSSIQKTQLAVDLAKKYNEAWRAEEYTSDEIAADRAELEKLERKIMALRESIRSKVDKLPEVQELKVQAETADAEAFELRRERRVIEKYLNEKRKAGRIGSQE